MLRIRVKMGPQRSKEWTCCFGLHVHTATILIGLWHLFLNILALSLLAVIWRNPHMMEELENSYDNNVDLSAPALPTPLSKVEPPYAYRDYSLNYRKHYQNFDTGGLVCTCMIAITLMMIYGTIKGKPSHLLPFFCLQLFDFAITTLTAAGYVCYLQAIHRLVAESRRLPWREKLLELSPEELTVVVLVVFVVIVFAKAYAIGVVWRCYKYLTLRQQNLRTLLPCVIPDLANNMGEPRSSAYSTLLPNYEEAITEFLKHAPPPSYQAAMANYQPRCERHSTDDDDVAIEGGLDNNNDIPNNNNTMHVNANTPPMNRNDLIAAAVVALTVEDAIESAHNQALNQAHNEDDINIVAVESVDMNNIYIGNSPATGNVTPPPAYNAVVTLNVNDLEIQPMQQGGFVAIPAIVTTTSNVDASQININNNESQA